MIIINKPHLCTTIPIWAPKYHTNSGEYEVWISQAKVRYASPVIIIKFTKAKHLLGQRFCVRRQDVERSPTGTNGKIGVYKVPFDKLEGYDTGQEVRDLVNNLWEEP